MIYPDDSKSFSEVMDVTWQSLGRVTLEKATKRWWFDELISYPLGDVANAFDKYLLSGADKIPHVNDIVKLCKPRDFARIAPSPLTKSQNAEQSAKVQAKIRELTKPKKDNKAWAKNIMANPQNYPHISLVKAQKALEGSLSRRVANEN